MAENFKEIEYHDGQRPWRVPCDIALPCATQNEIEKEDAEALLNNKVRAVCEGWKEQAMKMQAFGLDFGNPDFVKYAESYGAKGHRLKATEDLGPLLEQCLEAEGVHVIDVPVDYSQNDRLLNREIPERSRALDL